MIFFDISFLDVLTPTQTKYPNQRTFPLFFQVLDQLDKKKKVVLEQQSKGEKLAQDPKAPKFLNSYMDRLKALWTDANKQAENRLAALKGETNQQNN